MNYSTEIKECSKQLSAKQRIAIKDTISAIKLDKATQDGPIIITPDYYAVLSVHNEKADDKDYEQFIIVDVSGDKYVTGSKSFWSSFINIYEEMENEDEAWSIKVYRVESKNYVGRDFITCSIE